MALGSLVCALPEFIAPRHKLVLQIKNDGNISDELRMSTKNSVSDLNATALPYAMMQIVSRDVFDLCHSEIAKVKSRNMLFRIVRQHDGEYRRD